MKPIFISLVAWALASSAFSTAQTAESQADRVLKIAVLQAGEGHSKNGNPCFERNFAVFDSLALAYACTPRSGQSAASQEVRVRLPI